MIFVRFLGGRIYGFYLAIAQGIFFWENENEFLAKTMLQRLTPALETQASQLKPSVVGGAA